MANNAKFAKLEMEKAPRAFPTLQQETSSQKTTTKK
jgi:hypothetical protein